MKRTVKYALSAAMAAAFVVPAFAQSDTPFPDTKENHWAYEAVTRLKTDGILVGYPNGMFIGNRLATRYEMAVAINAAYTKLKNLTDGLSKQIDDINGKIKELQDRPTGPSQADFDALKAALNDVKDQVAGMRSYGQDIADLKRLAEKFEKDLAALGVDVDDLKKSLAALDKRVTFLEAHRLPIDIHGDMNFMSMSGYGTSSSYGVDVTGRPLGVGRGPNSADAMSDNTLFHELGFDITTNNEKGPKGEIVAVIGNMLDTPGAGLVNGQGNTIGPFTSMSTGAAGTPYAPGSESVYIQKAMASFGNENSGLPFSGQVGRIGLKLGSYILERPDYNPYYDNARWSNGEWSVDGFKLGFKLGMLKLHVFGAEASVATDSQGTVIQPMFPGGNGFTGPFGPGANGLQAAISTPGEVNQLAGAHLWVPIGKDGNIDLSYVLLQSNTPAGAGGANNMQDYGVDVNWKFTNALKVWGGYSKTDTSNGTHNVNNKNDQRATGYLGYDAANWGVVLGGRYIDGLFAAPGSWGRIGTWWNPTGISGFDGSGHIDFAKAFALKGSFEYYQGTGASKFGLPTSTKITRATGDLGYKFGSGIGVDFGAEDVMVTGTGGPKPQELWINLGASYDFSDNAKFSLLWQISNMTNTAFGAGAFANWGPTTSNKGGLITSQFSIKF